jgi:RNA polymerase sigma factor (sigma-70 family)
MTEDELLHEALCQLDPKQRALITLRFWDDQTQEQVASELGIPLGSMTYNERRALKELKQIYLKLRKDQGHYEE